jgi:PIN domain nuclease of toxin-antitoxin system
MARLLLDTHVFIWWCVRDRRLRRRPHDAIINADEVFVSAASAWEIALKVSLGKLTFPLPVEEACRKAGFGELPVRTAHADAVRSLEKHHTDPFDRLLVAQTKIEGLAFVTADRALAPYRIDTIWV